MSNFYKNKKINYYYINNKANYNIMVTLVQTHKYHGR